MYKQRNYIYLLIFTLLFFSSKWIATFFFEFNESFLTKIIFDTSDIHYYPVVFGISKLNFFPSFVCRTFFAIAPAATLEAVSLADCLPPPL